MEYAAPLDYTEVRPSTLLMKSLQGPQYCNKIITVKRYESQAMSLGLGSHTSQAPLASCARDLFPVFHCTQGRRGGEAADNDHIAVWPLERHF